MSQITSDSSPSETTTPTPTPPGTPPGTVDQPVWWQANSLGRPPDVDPKTTEQIREGTTAEVGQCGLVPDQAMAQDNQVKASGAQYSQGRVKASIAALTTLGTTDPVAQQKAAELQRQYTMTEDLSNTGDAHRVAARRYGNTVLLRKQYIMGLVRPIEEDVHQRAKIERVKPNPDPKVLSADDAITAAQQKDAADKHKTSLDHENRASDSNEAVANLQAQITQLQQVNKQQAEVISQLQQQALLNGGGAAASGAATHTAHGKHASKGTGTTVATAPSEANRRKGSR